MNRAWIRPTLALLATAATLASHPPALALDAAETDAGKIMAAVEGRDTGDKMVARMQMTIRDSSGRDRVRVVQSRSMKVAGGRKQFMIFESPADVRNTALLTFDYDDGDKDDDQWIYLPSLHKATRISGADRSGAFMGSDFSYADMTKKDPKLYSYTMAQASAKVGDDDCWLIEARPKGDKERRETGYLKSLVWISKTKLVPLQSKIWVAEGKKIKLIKSDRLKQIDGIWVPHRLAVRTTRGAEVESSTILDFLSVKLNDASVQEADFSQRRLEQGL